MAEPALAALLLGKVAEASERGSVRTKRRLTSTGSSAPASDDALVVRDAMPALP